MPRQRGVEKVCRCAGIQECGLRRSLACVVTPRRIVRESGATVALRRFDQPRLCMNVYGISAVVCAPAGDGGEARLLEMLRIVGLVREACWSNEGPGFGWRS